jgi:protein SCO1/2
MDPRRDGDRCVEMKRTMFATLMVLAAALFCAHATTHGFRALTSDKARQVEFTGTPVMIPDIQLVDSHNRIVPLRNVVGQKPWTVVALVYTQCTTLCLLTASGESWLQANLRAKGLDAHVGLLTISFDPARDTPDALADYARRVKAKPEQWKIATVAHHQDLDRLLDAFGIVVLPDENGELIHNGALFLVDRHGRIFDAYDPDAPDEVLVRLDTLASTQ